MKSRKAELFPEYGLPVDDDELDRIDMNNTKYTLLQDDQLFLAPLDSDPEKVLDIGTGTGMVTGWPKAIAH